MLPSSTPELSAVVFLVILVSFVMVWQEIIEGPSITGMHVKA
jgi:hypothetical protein